MLPVRADAPASRAHARQRERREDRDREQPAIERHRHRRNVVGEAAADDPVARPEERRERQQQIGRSGSRRATAADWTRHRPIIADAYDWRAIPCTRSSILRMSTAADRRRDGRGDRSAGSIAPPHPAVREPAVPARDAAARSSRAARSRPKRIACRRSRAPPTRSRSRSSRRRGARAARTLAVVCADALAAQRLAEEIAVVRAGACASRCCPTGRRCPTTISRRTRTSCPSGSRRSIASSRGEFDVVLVAAHDGALPPARRRRTSPAHTFFLDAGREARRRRAARAARARRLLARHAGRLAGRVQRARRADRPVSDGQRAALPHRSLRRRDRDRSRRSTSTRSARSTRCRDVRLLPAREFPLDEAGRTRFRSRFREVFEGDPSKSRALQGHLQRRRAAAASSTTCRCSSTRRRRSPTTCRRDAIVALHGDVARRDRALLAGHRSRATGCCAATRRGRCCRRTSCSCRPTRSTARSSRSRASRSRRSTRTPPRPSTRRRAACRRAGRPPRRRSARRAEALRSRRSTARVLIVAESAGPARDDAALLRRVRLAAGARSTTSPRSSPATRRVALVRRRRSHAGFALAGSAARVRHRGRALRRRRAPRARATPARRSNVDAMLRDLSEVRIGDPVVHEQHGIGRYLGLVTLDLGDGPNGVPAARLRQRRQALRAGLEPAPDQPLQRRVARGRAAARARQRPVGEGEAQGGAAGARHRRRAAQPLRAARRAQGPRVRVQAARLRGVRRRLRLRGDARPGRRRSRR